MHRKRVLAWFSALALLSACSGDDGGDGTVSAGDGVEVDVPETPGDTTPSTGDAPAMPPEPGNGSDDPPVGGDQPMGGDGDEAEPADGDGADPAPQDEQPTNPGNPAPVASLADGLVAHYAFDSGDLTDQTDNDFDATLGTGADCAVDGAFGGACELTPRGHLQVAADPFGGDVSGGWSGAGWIKVDEPGMPKYLFALGVTEALAVKYIRGGVLCAMKDETRMSRFLESGSAIDTGGEWHHIACVYDPSAGTLVGYVDGEPGEPLSIGSFGPLAGNNLTMGIGCLPDPIACTMTSPFTTMSVDDIRIWERALSPAEVQSLAGAR